MRWRLSAADVFGKNANPDMVAVAALFHDASEIFTGDMPTPIKYHNPEISSAYKKWRISPPPAAYDIARGDAPVLRTPVRPGR
jgi:hypothetical protein